jgi:flagellar motility protein MotE (MotC chaperone)
MEDLKHLLDNANLTEINQEVHQFVHSADGYENRLKLVFALQYLNVESDKLLRTVDMDGFISDIQERIGNLNKQSEKMCAEYHAELTQNDLVARALADSSDNRIEDIQHQISKLLEEYDAAIKTLVELREKMSIEQQISAEGKDVKNT